MATPDGKKPKEEEEDECVILKVSPVSLIIFGLLLFLC